MFNKLLLKLSIVLIAVLAMSASPVTANTPDSHDPEEIVPGHTVDGGHHDEDTHHEEAPAHE